MLQQIYQYCTSYGGLVWFALASDLAIAAAYFAIPVTMAVVLAQRKDDIPYPWLWTLFVTFIVACGLTHVVHVWSAVTGTQYLGAQAIIGVIAAAASVGTAIAFVLIVPQIKSLPSPRKQRAFLEETVNIRTSEKDSLIREINHRVGNQLQIMTSLVRIETRRAQTNETIAALARIAEQIQPMIDQHYSHSAADYLGMDMSQDPRSLQQLRPVGAVDPVKIRAVPDIVSDQSGIMPPA